MQKDLTLDLDGYTLNIAANKIYVLSNATFKDSSVDNSGKISGTGSYKIYVGYSSGGTEYPGSLTAESGTYNTSGNGVFRVSASVQLTLNGATVKANQYPVYLSAASAKMTMNGATVEATSAVGVYVKADAELTVKKGKTVKIKPTLKSKKKVTTHIAKLRYESSNTKIATVDKKGNVKGKKKGTATIYVYAQNGICKKIKVNVK